MRRTICESPPQPSTPSTATSRACLTSSHVSAPRSEPLAPPTRPQHRVWCRRRSRSIAALPPVIGAPRRPGRLHRLRHMNGLRRHWQVCTRPLMRRAWQGVELTRPGGRSTRCGGAARDLRRREPRRSPDRRIGSAAELGGPPAGGHPRAPAAIPARSCARAGCRPMERRGADVSRFTARLPVGATKARCRTHRACLARRAPAEVVALHLCPP